MKGAAEAKEKAEGVVRDYQQRLAQADADAKGIREGLRAEGEREKARLLRDTEELASKIKNDADS